jgi:hypothetical protein
MKLLNRCCWFQEVSSTAEGGRRLIISSGDISDVDGFLALAEYSKVRMASQKKQCSLHLKRNLILSVC